MQDDARAPPYLQFTFYSIHVPPSLLNSMLQMVNLDPKVRPRDTLYFPMPFNNANIPEQSHVSCILKLFMDYWISAFRFTVLTPFYWYVDKYI